MYCDYDPIRYYKENTNIIDFKEQAIGFSCNCVKDMGIQLKLSFPELYKADMEWEVKPKDRLGKFLKVNLNDGRTGYLLYTQLLGSCKNLQTRYWAIGTALSGILEDMYKNGLKTLALPKIGAGIENGNGDWETIRNIISIISYDSAAERKIKIVIYPMGVFLREKETTLTQRNILIREAKKIKRNTNIKENVRSFLAPKLEIEKLCYVNCLY